MIATIGGLSAASRVRITGRKSRADSYLVLMPVSAVNCVRTFWNASCSLPPQSEEDRDLPRAFLPCFAPAVVAAARGRCSDREQADGEERDQAPRHCVAPFGSS